MHRQLWKMFQHVSVLMQKEQSAQNLHRERWWYTCIEEQADNFMRHTFRGTAYSCCYTTTASEMCDGGSKWDKELAVIRSEDNREHLGDIILLSNQRLLYDTQHGYPWYRAALWVHQQRDANISCLSPCLTSFEGVDANQQWERL